MIVTHVLVMFIICDDDNKKLRTSLWNHLSLISSTRNLSQIANLLLNLCLHHLVKKLQSLLTFTVTTLFLLSSSCCWRRGMIILVLCTVRSLYLSYSWPQGMARLCPWIILPLSYHVIYVCVLQRENYGESLLKQWGQWKYTI